MALHRRLPSAKRAAGWLALLGDAPDAREAADERVAICRQPLRSNVVLYDGDRAGMAVLVAKPFQDPLRGMPLHLQT